MTSIVGSGTLTTVGHGRFINGFSLHIGGHLPASGSMVGLFTQAGVETGPRLNLFIDADPLSLNKKVDLFIEADVVQSGQMNLVSKGGGTVEGYSFLQSDLANASGTMNLFVRTPSTYLADGTVLTTNTTLFMKNALVQSTGSVPLTIGETLVVSSGIMNLFMSRDSEAVEESTTLYLEVDPPTSSGDTTLFTMGRTVSSGDVTLVIPNTISSASGDILLYVHGYTP